MEILDAYNKFSLSELRNLGISLWFLGILNKVKRKNLTSLHCIAKGEHGLVDRMNVDDSAIFNHEDIWVLINNIIFSYIITLIK